MTEPRFWLVWREDGGAPTVKHASEAAATSEANRLADIHAGAQFIVLAAKAGYRIPPRQCERTAFAGRSRPASRAALDIDDDEIPF